MPYDFPAELMDHDLGAPLGTCAETLPGVFVRHWSKGEATVDCNKGGAFTTLN